MVKNEHQPVQKAFFLCANSPQEAPVAEPASFCRPIVVSWTKKAKNDQKYMSPHNAGNFHQTFKSFLFSATMLSPTVRMRLKNGSVLLARLYVTINFLYSLFSKSFLIRCKKL